MTNENRTFAFQYVKLTKRAFMSNSVEIVCDKTSLTESEANDLWNEHYPDAAKWIAKGESVEMVIWCNMDTPHSFGDHKQYISTDAESDGVTIWVNERKTFPKTIS